MKDIELYDIISLKNGNNYTVLRMIQEQEKMYFLLAKVDENEEPDTNDIKIAEEITQDGKKYIKEIEDENLIEKLGDLFISAIDADV